MSAEIAPFTALDIAARVAKELTDSGLVADLSLEIERGADVTLRLRPARCTRGSARAYLKLPLEARIAWTEHVRGSANAVMDRSHTMTRAARARRLWVLGVRERLASALTS